jgi:hypothetical protein
VCRLNLTVLVAVSSIVLTAQTASIKYSTPINRFITPRALTSDSEGNWYIAADTAFQKIDDAVSFGPGGAFDVLVANSASMGSYCGRPWLGEDMTTVP